LLGAASRQYIPLYANINRRTVDRSPDGFAASARIAVERGFSTIKIAPFDGVAPGSSADVTKGIARVEAVRAEIGPSRTLLVDCHWRFDEENARVALGRLAEIGISWFECPLPEVPESFDSLRRLRAAANANRIRLAGAETETGVDGFRPFVEGGLYDVIMPDVKYAGGLAEMRKIADFAAAHGVDVSPHNPSGPICHVASLQFCAALERETMLEHQFDESPVFFEIIDGALPTPIAGNASLPQANGLGISLREDQLARPKA
jgi:galactonate dehydratase